MISNVIGKLRIFTQVHMSLRIELKRKLFYPLTVLVPGIFKRIRVGSYHAAR